VGITVVFDGAPDCRCHRGELVGGEINCWHGPDIFGRHLFNKELRIGSAPAGVLTGADAARSVTFGRRPLTRGPAAGYPGGNTAACSRLICRTDDPLMYVEQGSQS
jgi:hypothetical protein